MDAQSVQLLAALSDEYDEYMAEANEEANEEAETETTQGASHSQSASKLPQTVNVSNKRQRSHVWQEFVEVGVELDGKRRSHCLHCDRKLVTEKGQGTKAMIRHLESCPKRPSDIAKQRQYDHKVDREMMSEIIIYHDQPFRYVEYEKVRARDKYLNPNCRHICRQTAGADVIRRYELEKEKLKRLFAEYIGKVSFTADMWTARTTMMGYICLTAHFVDERWILNNKILAFCDVKRPHTGEELANTILSCLKEWGLEKKVFTVTLDNATSNDSMQKILLHRLQMINGNGLLCDGKFFHVRCCAHILNLIVQQGLELASGLLENIRNSVKFVKASGSRRDAFAACVESLGIKRIILRCTYKMELDL